MVDCFDKSHDAYIQQLCALKSKLVVLKLKYEELQKENEGLNTDLEDTNTDVEELIDNIVSGFVSESDFEEYKKQQLNKGYLTEIDSIYITEEELKEILNSIFIGNAKPEYKQWIYDAMKCYVKQEDLNLYIAEYLSGHDVTQYIDVTRLTNQINNLFDNYYTKTQVDTNINNVKRELTDLINSGKTITKDQFGYSPAITESTTNSYLIGTLKLPNNTYRLYGKDGAISGGSSSGGYDDTNIRSIISNLQALLNDIKNGSKVDIESTVQSVLNEFDWLSNNVEWDKVFHTSNWDDSFERYLQTVGIIGSDGISSWSTLEQKYNEISAQVSAIRLSIGSGDLNLDVLQSNLKAYVDTATGNAVTNAVSKYALVDNQGYVLDWFASGFESQASRGGSFALIYSATERAVSALRTDVDDIKATAILAANFDDRVAGVIASANVSQAILALVGDSVNVTTDSLNVVSKNALNDSIVNIEYDSNGYPEIKVKSSQDDPDDELVFGVITSPAVTAKNVTNSSSYSRSNSVFFGDGSARLANGNIWWDEHGTVHINAAKIGDQQSGDINASTIEAQSVLITANVLLNNVWNTGLYLYNMNTTPHTWHRVIVDQNGFLKVDMNSQGDL